MKRISPVLLAAIALLVLMTIGTDALADGGSAAPSGCRTTTLKNTLNFTEARTGNPSTSNIVIGAFTVKDDDVIDTGVVEGSDCVPPGPVDGHPTHVTALTVRVAGGDPASADVRAVRLAFDGNRDGFFQAGQDTLIGLDQPGSCLYTECLFTFGRTSPIFTVGQGSSTAIIVMVDLGPSARPGANLSIVATAEANNIVTMGPAGISSDFNDTFRTQASNIILNAPQGNINLYGLNNGSGNAESGFQVLQLTGLKTRFRDEEIRPGTREAIAAFLYVCEGGTTISSTVIVLPPVAVSGPTVAGYPGALACINSSHPDGFGTRILRVRVGVSGNASAVGTMRLYDDGNDNGILFEGNELVLSSNPISGIATFGSLNNPLLAITRSAASPAPGHYAPLTPANPFCTPNMSNGASKGCPHILIVTFDVASNAPSGPVNFDVVLDVGNLPGEVPNSPFASSNMITTQPQRSTVTITGGGSTGSSLAKSVAMHSGDPNLIEDDDIIWALSKWTLNQPIDGMTVSDSDMILLISKWAAGASVQAVVSLLSAVTHQLGAKAQSLAVQSIALSQTPDTKQKAFTVMGLGIQKTNVRVYSLSGAIVFNETAEGPTVVFRNANTLPNGVYFYVVTVTGFDGKVIQTQARKLVLVR
ncbi:T9SS type A sorting domain-containing protein [Candidatus Acetothermia bacterium]|nr:T9SS type A sorting domain-containing protein [Candidatus Acetothermia bacterium]